MKQSFGQKGAGGRFLALALALIMLCSVLVPVYAEAVDEQGAAEQAEQTVTGSIKYIFHVGDETTEVTVPSGSTLTKPADPTAPEGQRFKGWFLADGQEFTSFDKTVSTSQDETVALYAHFEAAQPVSNEQNPDEPQTDAPAQQPEEPKQPETEGSEENKAEEGQNNENQTGENPGENNENQIPTETPTVSAEPIVNEVADPYLTLYNEIMNAPLGTEEEIAAFSALLERADEGFMAWLEQPENEAYLYAFNEKINAGVSTQASNSGTFDHIEIEIDGKVTVKIDGEEDQVIDVVLTTSDTYTVRAYRKVNGAEVAYTDFTFSNVSKGNGATGGKQTVKLGGTYKTGTYNDRIYYVVSVTKNITFTLSDGTTLTVPVTLVKETNYWAEDNHCPGIGREQNTWNNGQFVGNSGIDTPISGTYAGKAITEGKLAIKKVVIDENGSVTNDNTEFRFYLKQDSEGGQYLKFSNNEFVGFTDTLENSCYVTVKAGESLTLTKIPVGYYKITEIQENGYVITDAEGKESDAYTRDFVIENKTDDKIPIANFQNKKLNNEAGIKLRKVGEGLQSYPNPTVSIYKAEDVVNGVPKEGATPVWSGNLTTNDADFIYPKVTLTAGQEYVLVETIASVEGYELKTTTLTVDNTLADGMTFTAEAGKVHELIVTNTYEEQAKAAKLTVKKTVTGNAINSNNKFAFTVTYKVGEDEDETETTENFSLGDEETKEINIPFGATVTVTELPAGYTYSLKAVTPNTLGYANVENGISFTMPEEDVTVEINNDKSITPDTGILLDSWPYLIALAFVTAGAILTFAQRRRRDVD